MSWSHFSESNEDQHRRRVSLPPISQLLNDVPVCQNPDSDRHTSHEYYDRHPHPSASSYPAASDYSSLANSRMPHRMHSSSGPTPSIHRTGYPEQDFRHHSSGRYVDSSRAAMDTHHASNQMHPHWNTPQSLPQSNPPYAGRSLPPGQNRDWYPPPAHAPVGVGHQSLPPRPPQFNHPSASTAIDVTRDMEAQTASAKLNHTCEYCGKAFLRPSALKTHLISHTGDQDFACPEEGCSRRFGVRSNMLRHVRLVHKHLKHSSGEQLSQEEWETGEPGP